MSDPTIRLSTCRQDGRCPVCEAAGWITNSPTKGRVSVWRGIPCGCTICSGYACVTEHTRDLLTEALRQIRDGKEREEVFIRQCSAANTMLAQIVALPDVDMVGEDAVAWVSNSTTRLREERDAAIRENVAADQRGWERAISAVRFALADYPHAGLDSEIGAQVERIVAKKTESAIRERDEARARVALCEEFSAGHPGMCCCQCIRQVTEAKERADRAEALLAEARAEHRDISQRYIAASSARIRAEALLRECQQYMGGLGLGRRGQELLAKIRETTKVEES